MTDLVTQWQKKNPINIGGFKSTFTEPLNCAKN